jgi:pimeloyl-ACP methyl ester carboxylesterase
VFLTWYKLYAMKNTRIFLAGFFLLICLFGCKHVPYGNNPPAGKYYNIRGFKMYCEVYGTGKPLLMIHGNSGSIGTFYGNIPYFADKYKVIIADSRAQGKSLDDRDSLSYEMMADDYAALLDTMHIDSAYVIGWSDGGVNTLLLAMRHPEKVKKMAVSGANLWPDSTAIEPKVWKEEMKKYNGFKGSPGKTAKERFERKLFLLDWEEPHILPADLHKIKCPALVIGGDHDLVRKQHTELIFKNIPRANLWIVPNSGHGTLFEHRRKFNSNIDDFFINPYQPHNNY